MDSAPTSSNGLQPNGQFAHGLAYLLGGMPPAVLAGEFWAKQPLLIRGERGKFESLFDRARLAAAMRAAQAAIVAERLLLPEFVINASFERGSASVPGRQRIAIQPYQWQAMHAAGATVCVNAIDRFDAGLSRFARRVKAELGYPGEVRFNCYYSPDGAGFSTHFDVLVTTTLQIEGRKRWRYAPAAVTTWPADNGELTDYESEERAGDPWRAFCRAELVDVVLEAGDLLMLPSGTWHEAEAVDGDSLALNLAFEPFSFLTLVSETLRGRLAGHARWRGSPLHPRGDAAVVDAERAPFTAMLEELAAEIRALADDPSELWSAWAQRTTAYRPPLVSDPIAPRAAAVTAAPGPRALLEVVQDDAFQFVVTRSATGDRLVIALPSPLATFGITASRSIEIDDPLVIDWLRRVLRHSRFTLDHAVGWATESSLGSAAALEVMTALIELGVIAIIHDTARR